jgi:hypothetical protein
MFNSRELLNELNSDPVFKARFLNEIGDTFAERLVINKESNSICNFGKPENVDSIVFNKYSEDDFKEIYFEVAEKLNGYRLLDLFRKNPERFKGRENLAISNLTKVVTNHWLRQLMEEEFSKYVCEYISIAPVEELASRCSSKIFERIQSSINNGSFEDLLDKILTDMKK